MYRFILVAACACVVLASAEECKDLSHPKYIKCCKSPPAMKPEDMEDMKECFRTSKKPPSCDADICLAKKRGFAGSEDGKFDKEAATAVFEEMHKEDPELVKMVTEKCINGDLSKYGSRNSCDLMKLRHCVHAQVMLGCPDIDTEGKCSGLQELIDKCKDQ